MLLLVEGTVEVIVVLISNLNIIFIAISVTSKQRNLDSRDIPSTHHPVPRLLRRGESSLATPRYMRISTPEWSLPTMAILALEERGKVRWNNDDLTCLRKFSICFFSFNLFENVAMHTEVKC